MSGNLEANMQSVSLTEIARQRQALEWLDRELEKGAFYNHGPSPYCYLKEIKFLLSRPTLPQEPSEALVSAIWRIICDSTGHPRADAEQILAAIRADISRPKTKTVEVWRVEYAVKNQSGEWVPQGIHYRTEAAARDQGKHLLWGHSKSALECIRVTGPHTQDVPA